MVIIKGSTKVIIIIAVLLLLSFFVVIGAALYSFIAEGDGLLGNVALIPVKGVITTDKSNAFFSEQAAASSEIVKQIEKASKDNGIKAIIFEINSPGGSAVGSEEIANAVKKANKPTVAWIREVGASGGYWIASSTEHIVANRMSITGSIGVIASYLEFAGLLDRYNITYERMVAGKYKDLGTPFKELTEEERKIFQEELDTIHTYFIDEIAKNRKLPANAVKELSTGQIYLGAKAKELGLVDELGGKEEAVKYIENKLSIKAEIVEYREKQSFFDALANVLNKNNFYLGQGIGSMLLANDKPAITT